MAAQERARGRQNLGEAEASDGVGAAGLSLFRLTAERLGRWVRITEGGNNSECTLPLQSSHYGLVAFALNAQHHLNLRHQRYDNREQP